MPIRKADVLEVLGDARLRNIRFSVGPINVDSSGYARVADYINNDSIRVVPGNEAISLYYSKVNKLVTRAGDLTLGARTNLLHECTHMICDIDGCKVTRLTDEVAAYLAQTAYYLLLDPAPAVLIGSPLGRMTLHSMKLVEKYGLGQPAGMGAIIDQGDVAGLSSLIQAIPTYSHIGEDEMLPGNGVNLSDKHAEERRQSLKITDKYRQAIMQLATEVGDKLVADDVARLLTGLMTVRSVSRDNYVTWDPELLELFASYTRGEAAQKKDVLRRLLHIFQAIDQKSAERLKERLSALSRGDAVSERFQRTFSPWVRTMLLWALRIPR